MFPIIGALDKRQIALDIFYARHQSYFVELLCYVATKLGLVDGGGVRSHF